jgi:hypothetical protein
MVDDFVDIAPQYSFKPIEPEPVPPIDPLQLDTNSSCDSLDIGQGMLSPIDIFRDSIDGGESVVGDEDMGGFVRRANPINEQQSTTVAEEEEESDIDDEEMEMAASPCFRVISPYPYSHASKEEIEEREQLANVPLEWNLEMGIHHFSSAEPGEKWYVDYTSFFELNSHVNNDQVMAEDCEDFSLSSHEANTLSEDNFLGSISEDPASFWGDDGPVMSDRSQSPTQVSLGSVEL